MNSGFFEEELFRRCKNADTDPKATSGILLSEMEMMGILSDDPRIAPLIEALKEIQLKSAGKIYSINNIKLDYNQFTKVVRTCKCLICDVMEGNVVIPEFDDFCQDLRNIFERYIAGKTELEPGVRSVTMLGVERKKEGKKTQLDS